MDTQFWFEMVGYAGSVLVAVSLMMKSLLRLRLINLVGAFFFTLYGLLSGAYAVAAPYPPPMVYVAPAPVYYQPAVTYYRPAPVYFAPRPVVYAPPPYFIRPDQGGFPGHGRGHGAYVGHGYGSYAPRR